MDHYLRPSFADCLQFPNKFLFDYALIPISENILQGRWSYSIQDNYYCLKSNGEALNNQTIQSKLDFDG